VKGELPRLYAQKTVYDEYNTEKKGNQSRTQSGEEGKKGGKRLSCKYTKMIKKFLYFLRGSAPSSF